jgi:CRP-like cAMP-binding protein
MFTESVEKCLNITESSKSVFSTLNEKEKEFLRKNITCIVYKKGDIIFAEGDKPTGLIFLEDGKVKIFKEGIAGREQIVRMASPVGFIGYRAFFADKTILQLLRQ